MSRAAEDWAACQVEARDLCAGLEAGDYLHRWEDEEIVAPPGDALVAACRDVLARDGLTLDTDDVGIRVVERVEP